MKILSKVLATLPKIVLISFGLILTIIIAFIDYVTSYRLGFSLFYLLPILMIAWTCGLSLGSLMALFCALSWLLADYYSRDYYVNIFNPIWNTIVRAIIFFLVAYFIWIIRLLDFASCRGFFRLIK